jgi:TolB-like protein/class 3 adenylate cyclase
VIICMHERRDMAETRKLAAILAADIVGYSRLASVDEDRTLARLRTLRSDLIDPSIAIHNGRVVKRTGDGLIVEFRSVVDATRCAVDVQTSMVDRNAGLPEGQRIDFRIGIHLGDVVEENDGDLMGDGVNIAARLEGIAKPGAICLSEDAYRQVKARLDFPAADVGLTRLKNIAEPIRVYAFNLSNAGLTRPAALPAFDKAAPPRLSIVVLPFANIGGGEEQDHFVDGVTESLTTDLSRIRGSFVIGRNTAFTFKGKAVDLKQIGHELNVRYVLEGSVQRGGNRMRVNVQLIDAETGNHLWAERFDKTLADLFDMQDEIVSRLANALNTELVAAEARRAERTPNPDSMDLYFQGLAWSLKSLTPDNVAQARVFFDRALSVDPDNVDALIGSARMDAVAGVSMFAIDRRAAFLAAEPKLTKALSLVPDHARGHMTLGMLYIFTKRAAQGIAECEHALALDRNLALARALVGLGKIYMGCAEETEGHIVEALRLSPRDTLAHLWMDFAGHSKNHLGLHEQAIGWSQRAIEANRNNQFSYFNLGAALASTGRLEEARSAVKVGLALNPSFTLSVARVSYTAMSADPLYLSRLDPYLDALGAAGVPEQ